MAQDRTKQRAPRSTNGSTRKAATAAGVVRNAREELAELTGYPVDAVTGCVRRDDGWHVTVELVELARIPPTTDVLGTYEAVLDAQGHVVQYERVRRYFRNQGSDA